MEASPYEGGEEMANVVVVIQRRGRKYYGSSYCPDTMTRRWVEEWFPSPLVKKEGSWTCAEEIAAMERAAIREATAQRVRKIHFDSLVSGKYVFQKEKGQ